MGTLPSSVATTGTVVDKRNPGPTTGPGTHQPETRRAQTPGTTTGVLVKDNSGCPCSPWSLASQLLEILLVDPNVVGS